MSFLIPACLKTSSKSVYSTAYELKIDLALFKKSTGSTPILMQIVKGWTAKFSENYINYNNLAINIIFLAE